MSWKDKVREFLYQSWPRIGKGFIESFIEDLLIGIVNESFNRGYNKGFLEALKNLKNEYDIHYCYISKSQIDNLNKGLNVPIYTSINIKHTEDALTLSSLDSLIIKKV